MKTEEWERLAGVWRQGLRSRQWTEPQISRALKTARSLMRMGWDEREVAKLLQETKAENYDH